MKIIGDRVLVERVEKEQSDGFETVDVLDDFVCKGRIVQVGEPIHRGWGMTVTVATGLGQGDPEKDDLAVGNVILFAKFSPDTQEVKVDGKELKTVATSDIIAIL